MIISCTCWIFIFLFCGLLEFFLHGQQGLRGDQQDKLTVRISFKDVFGVWGNWNCVWNGILILSQMMETMAICSWTFLFHLCSYFGLQTKHVGNFFRWSKMFFIVNYHTSEFCHSIKKKLSGILRLDACNNVCFVFRMLLGFWMERMALQRYCEILTSVCWLRIPWIILWNWKNLYRIQLGCSVNTECECELWLFRM